jgi:hypothetical protein
VRDEVLDYTKEQKNIVSLYFKRWQMQEATYKVLMGRAEKKKTAGELQT